MKELCKRSLALLMVLVMVVGLLPAITVQTDAAGYVYNWGKREEVATELSDMAVAWYQAQKTSFAELSQLSGSSNQSSVPSSTLYQKLKTLMTSAHSYKTSYEATKELYRYTDCQNGGGKISSFYSGASIGPGWGEGGSWNREHTWPNSKGLGGQDENDIMMLRPTATSENSSRGNTAYGESGSYYDPNGESNGKYNLHGDVARIMLYTYVRWGNTSRMWGSNGVMESRAVLLKWMEEDPVDTWELGRNDAVQSITGTRNVFVDYPELVFQLFGVEVPDGYQTPSGSAPSYTITAIPNNTAYGTISMSGKTITATPYTGYQVSGYQVVSGKATVTRSGNTFTVSATSDCTIQIIFAPRTQATVTFVDRGKTVSTKNVYTGDSITMPTHSGTVPEEFVFAGWVEQQVTNTETKPTIYGANVTYSVSGTKTFYALYAKVGDGSTGETTFRLVTNINQLSQGEQVVITASGQAIAMKTTGGVNNRYAGSITKNSDNTISFLSNVPIDILTLGAGTTSGTYSFYSEANGQYLAAGTTSGSNILKLQSTVDAAASFTISVTSAGVATVTSKTSSDRKVLQYNSGNNIFACYESGQKAISLYVASGGGVLYYTTNPIECDHTNTKNVAAVAATCTQKGYTAGVYCNDCENYISGHEEVAALGHKYGNWVTTTNPTCTATGVQTKTCSTCGVTQTQSIAAAGHSYGDGVITKPATCTANGVKTYSCGTCGSTKTETISATGHHYELSGESYTCTGCGDSYDTWFVSFSVPAGVTAVEKIEYQEGGITLPSADVPSGEHTYTFAGWSKAFFEDTEEEPEIYPAGQKFTTTANTKLYAVYTYAVGGSGTAEYVLTDLADISPTDSVVITMSKGTDTYALTSANGGNATPTAVKVSVANGKLTNAPADSLKWNIGGTAGAYIIYVEGKTDSWLYCTNSNTGIRVGNNTNKTFKIDKNYLCHNGTSRYIGVYSGKDWRCYSPLHDNIANQTLAFYVKGEVGTKYYTTLTCEHNVELCQEVLPTLTQAGYMLFYCADCGEELYKEDYTAAYELNWNMTLQEDMVVNFKIDVYEALEDQMQILVTFDGKTETYTAANGVCNVAVNVAAAQVADNITVKFVLNGESVTNTYSVKKYVDQLLADAKQSQYHSLAQAMLNYSGAAQVYFENYTGEPVSTQYGENAVPAAAEKELSVTGAAQGLRFYGASLVYREKIAVRFYFTGDAEGKVFTANGKTYTAVEKNGLYYVEISNILPQNLDEQITVTVDGLTVAYSPMNYIVRMNQKDDAKLQNLMKALYNYHLAAKEYVAA